MFVLATWTVPPRSRVLISFLSTAYATASRIAGSAIGQPVPRSWTAGLCEQPPVPLASSTPLTSDQVGRLARREARVVRVLGEAQLLLRGHALVLERAAGRHVRDLVRTEAGAVD